MSASPGSVLTALFAASLESGQRSASSTVPGTVNVHSRRWSKRVLRNGPLPWGSNRVALWPPTPHLFLDTLKYMRRKLSRAGIFRLMQLA